MNLADIDMGEYKAPTSEFPPIYRNKKYDNQYYIGAREAQQFGPEINTIQDSLMNDFSNDVYKFITM